MASSPLTLPPPPASPGASSQQYSHPQFGSANANFMTIPVDGSQSTGVADGPLGSWFGKTVSYIMEVRYFNTFRADRVPTRDRTVRTPTRSGIFRTMRDGNICWREEKVTTRVQFYAAYNEVQRYELWRINLTQEAYYEFVTGLGGVAVDAAIDLPAAGAAVAGERAAAAAAAEGVAISAHGARLAVASRALGAVGATYLMFQVFTGAYVAISGGTRNAAGDLQSEGWEFVRSFEADPVEEEPEETWELVGSARPCTPAELEETTTLLDRAGTWIGDKLNSTKKKLIAGATATVLVIGGFLGLNGDGDGAATPTATVAATATSSAVNSNTGDPGAATATAPASTQQANAAGVPAAFDTVPGAGQVLVFRLDNVDFVPAGLTTIPAHLPQCSYEHVHGGEITSLLPVNGAFVKKKEHLGECGFGPPNFFLIADPR